MSMRRAPWAFIAAKVGALRFASSSAATVPDEKPLRAGTAALQATPRRRRAGALAARRDKPEARIRPVASVDLVLPAVSVSKDKRGIVIDFSTPATPQSPVEVPLYWVEDVSLQNFTSPSSQRLVVPAGPDSDATTIASAVWITEKKPRKKKVVRNDGHSGVRAHQGPPTSVLQVSLEKAGDRSTVLVSADSVAQLHPSFAARAIASETMNTPVPKLLWSRLAPGFREDDPPLRSPFLEPVEGAKHLVLPPQAVVENYFADPSRSRRRVLTAMEAYGFSLITDPSLSVNAPRALDSGSAAGAEETVKLRGANAEKLLLSVFRVLRNTHYGGYSTWRANVAVAAVKEASRGYDAARMQGTKVDGSQPHLDGAWEDSWLDLHTDSTYFREPPKVQGFGCLHRTSHTQGGYTTLADGFAVAEHIRAQDPAAFRLLSTVPIAGQYIKEDQHLVACRPAFELHPETGSLSRVTFNNSDRVAFRLSPSLPNRADLEAMYRAYNLLHRTLHSPQFHVRFLLLPGSMCCFDNHRVLHGRAAFSGPRVMGGAYIGVDDYYSSLLSVATPPAVADS